MVLTLTLFMLQLLWFRYERRIMYIYYQGPGLVEHYLQKPYLYLESKNIIY